MCLQSYHSLQSVQQQSSDKLQLALEPLDTKKPMDISEEEELERISALLQRDNLVRGLGIVEHVYRSVLYIAPPVDGIRF